MGDCPGRKAIFCPRGGPAARNLEPPPRILVPTHERTRQDRPRPRPRPRLPGGAEGRLQRRIPAALRAVQGSRLQCVLPDHRERHGRARCVPGDLRDRAPQAPELPLRVEVLQLGLPRGGQRCHRHQAPRRQPSGDLPRCAPRPTPTPPPAPSRSATRRPRLRRPRPPGTNWRPISSPRSTVSRRR